MRHIFLTGGTGVIGSALITQLLENQDDRLTVLLRASSHDQLVRRANNLLEFCGATHEGSTGRVRFTTGDVCREHLAIPGNDYADLLNTVTHIIHSAGNVKLNQTLEAARRNAVDSVEHILSFARRARNLKKLDVVSTIGVGGRMPGVIPERRLTELRLFHNNYEQAKAEAEEVLWNAVVDGLPVAIHRPSMVVGESRSGRIIRFQVFYYLIEFLSGRRTWGILPDLGDVTLDIIPADVVAQGIALSSNSPESSGRVFHLCSGPNRSIKLKDLLHLVTLAMKSRREKLSRLKHISAGPARRLASLASRVTTGRLSRSLATIPYFLDYLDESQVFQVDHTIDCLGPLGWHVPAPVEYLDHVLDYYFQTKSADQAAAAV